MDPLQIAVRITRDDEKGSITYTQRGSVESMNHGDGDIGVGKLGESPESAVMRVALPQKRKHLALRFQKGMDDGLNMGSAEVTTVTKGHDLDLAVADGARLVR